MDRVERSYFPDGSLQEEIHYLDSTPHGWWRKWHPNGALASEKLMRHGSPHGRVQSWYPTGQPECDLFMLNGFGEGRWVTYQPDGSVLSLKYVLKGRPVSQSKYEQACEARPELPRYSDLAPPKPKTLPMTSPRSTRTGPSPDEAVRHENVISELLTKRNE